MCLNVSSTKGAQCINPSEGQWARQAGGTNQQVMSKCSLCLPLAPATETACRHGGTHSLASLFSASPLLGLGFISEPWGTSSWLPQGARKVVPFSFCPGAGPLSTAWEGLVRVRSRVCKDSRCCIRRGCTQPAVGWRREFGRSLQPVVTDPALATVESWTQGSSCQGRACNPCPK